MSEQKLPDVAKKKRKQAWLWGILVSLGVFLALIAVLSMIKITPWADYKNPQIGVSFKYPAYWSRIDKPEGGAAVAFFAPKQTEMDTFAENINLVVQEVPADMSGLDQYTREAIKQVVGVFKKSITVDESQEITVAGRNGYRFSYVGTGPEMSFKILHVWFIEGTRAYVFTYTAMEPDFDVYAGEFAKLVSSIKLP